MYATSCVEDVCGCWHVKVNECVLHNFPNASVHVHPLILVYISRHMYISIFSTCTFAYLQVYAFKIPPSVCLWHTHSLSRSLQQSTWAKKARRISLLEESGSGCSWDQACWVDERERETSGSYSILVGIAARGHAQQCGCWQMKVCEYVRACTISRMHLSVRACADTFKHFHELLRMRNRHLTKLKHSHNHT